MKHLLLFSLLAGLCLRGSAVAASESTLSRATPESQGISSAALGEFLTALEQKVDAVHSVIIVRHGHVVAEGWWSPYAAAEPHTLFSLSKSFTSTAVGLAQAEGKLSIDDPVLKFFPEAAPAHPGDNLKAMRIHDLLRMSTGHHATDIDPFPFQSQEDLVKNFLSRPVTDKPGTHFFYNTAATYVLSAIVQKVTGQTVLDYLRPRLFEPLGIADPVWDASAQGISFGGFGLSLRTEDIAKFGQLFLQKGEWQGRRLVPADWIEAATSRETANGSSPDSDWDQGYGYQFWRCRHGFYRGDGAFGQFCIVMPQYDTVVAVTSGTANMGAVMNVIWDRLLPELRPAPLPADAGAQAALATRLAVLALRTPAGAATSPVAAKIAGRRFTFAANDAGLESFVLEPASDGTVTYRVRIRGTDAQVACGSGTWLKGTFPMGPGPAGPAAAAGAWTADDTYTVKLCMYRTPFIATYHLRFAGNDVTVEIEQNVGFGTNKPPALTGHAQ